ncbi:JAB domain-containing protein [Betaproteobacteria bacterium SCN2]|jgi:DNA repair protein RadC|nr:JAB domain-containing protein [Betaproteobacteria bacterium SCN2]
MGIKDWPADERPREKLLERGAASLTDAELLALFLRTGVAGRSAVDLARELLDRFGGLSRLCLAERDQICEAPGLGPAKYAQLKAVMEMAARALKEDMKSGDALSSPAAVRRYLSLLLKDKPHEEFWAVFLDAQNRAIQAEMLFRGTLTQTSVYPREVVKRALAHNAASLILAHNHPSGVAEPSQADRLLTQALRQALALVEVRVLDHFVVAGAGGVSFAEAGLL